MVNFAIVKGNFSSLRLIT